MLTVLVTFGAVGCRAHHSDTTSASSTATTDASPSPTGPTTTVAGSAVSQPTDDVEADLDGVTEQLHQADQDLGDAQTEATTDTRG